MKYIKPILETIDNTELEEFIAAATTKCKYEYFKCPAWDDSKCSANTTVCNLVVDSGGLLEI